MAAEETKKKPRVYDVEVIFKEGESDELAGVVQFDPGGNMTVIAEEGNIYVVHPLNDNVRSIRMTPRPEPLVKGYRPVLVTPDEE